MDFFEDNSIDLEQLSPEQLSPLVLAYIGDAVFEMFARTYAIKNSRIPVKALHEAVTAHVSAKGQSGAIARIYDMLSEDEQRIYKRGRNAKSATVPKNANAGEYRRATGLESLIGYKYLSGDHARLNEILNLCIEGWIFDN